MKERTPFIVMAKPVGSRCNMRCSYCYYLEKGRFSTHERQTCMSIPLLETLIRQMIEASDGPVVSFVWHGGEPTLAGLDFYKTAVELERKHLPRGRQAWNNLQTNGLLLDDAWCAFLAENRFDVGISIDGNEAVHDRNRKTAGGEATFGKTVEAIRRLQRHGIQPDLLCTVNADTLRDPLAVYDSLRQLRTGWIQFIPIVVPMGEGALSPRSVTGEQYGEFLCTVFDQWVTHDLGMLDVQLFAESARVLAGGEAGVCYMAPTCGRVLVVEEDGGVYACDHFVDDAHRLGYLGDRDLRALADSPGQIAFGDAKAASLTGQCKRCPWLKFCGGGCPKDRFARSEDGEAGHYSLCRGVQMFYEHALPIMEDVMRQSRQGVPPEEIMHRLRVLQTA